MSLGALFNVGTNILDSRLRGRRNRPDSWIFTHLDDPGTDDQTAAEVSYDNTTSGLTAGNTQAAIDELAAGSTDDQQLDDPNTLFNAGTNELTIALEDGGTATADLSALDNPGTDDQIASEVNITDAGGNFTATEVEGALAELAAGSTDDQNIESLGVDVGTNILTVGIEDGTSQTVDLSHLDDSGTDDQTAAEVTYDNTTSGLTAGDTQAALDELAAGSTDDQTIDGLSISGGVINLSLEDDGAAPVTLDIISNDPNNDISAGTDGALYLNVASVTISETNTTLGFNGATNELTYTNELGNNPVLDLSSLVGTDDQIANEVNITDAAGNFTATEVEGALAELAAGSTDDQNLTGATLTGNSLQIDIEGGSSTTVDLSSLVGTDDQIANEVNITDAAGNFTVHGSRRVPWPNWPRAVLTTNNWMIPTHCSTQEPTS